MAVNRQRGLLKLATEIGAQVPVDRGSEAQGIAALADSFSQIGNRVGKLADHAAAKEGDEAGRLAGIDPEFRPTRNMTIRGEAFDEAGLAVHRSLVKERLQSDLEAAKDQYSDNPAALAKALDAKRGEWLANSLPEVRPDIEVSFEKSKLTFMREATRAQTARLVAENKATAENEMAQTLRTIQQRAFSLGLDPMADATLASDIGDLTKALDRRGIDGKPLFTQAQRKKALEAANAEVATSRLFGAFSRLGGLEEKQKFIDGFREDFANSRGLAKQFDFKDFRTIEGQLEAELRSASSENNVTRRAAEAGIRQVAKQAEDGVPVPAGDMAALKAKVSAAGDPKLAADLDDAVELLKFQQFARTRTPPELDTFLAGERNRVEKDGASPFEAKRLDLGEKLLDRQRIELKQDPLGWAEKAGVVQVPPVDMSSAEAGMASLTARVSVAEEVASLYGQEPVYLRPDEKVRIAAAAAQGGESLIAVTTAIAAATGPAAPKVLAEISKEAPVVAMLGGLTIAAGPTAAARDAADGIAMKREMGEAFKPMAPGPQKAREAAVSVLNGAMANLPQTESAAIALANSIYEIRARRTGASEFDTDLWSQGLREALGERDIGGEIYGGVVNQGGGWFSTGTSIVLPPTVKQDSWRQIMDTLQPEDLEAAGLGKPVGSDGKPVSLSRLKAATLVQYGAGVYDLALGDPSDPGQEQWVYRDAPGTPFRLDLNNLSPSIRKRRPDLFLGGE